MSRYDHTLEILINQLWYSDAVICNFFLFIYVCLNLIPIELTSFLCTSVQVFLYHVHFLDCLE